MANACHAWAKTELGVEYHDSEWGVPVHDDTKLFECLILEGAQAGLSWETILKKRARYRLVYDGFDPRRVAAYDARKRRSLLNDAGIVRNRLKVEASVTNARAFLSMQEEFGSFDAWLWSFVSRSPIVNRRRSLKDMPARTELSDTISKELKRRGFRFVGSTIIYAFLQGVGVVNDHLITCPRWNEVGRLGKRVSRRKKA